MEHSEPGRPDDEIRSFLANLKEPGVAYFRLLQSGGGRLLSDRDRRRAALIAGRKQLIDDSPIPRWVEAGKLSADVLDLLGAILLLQGFEEPSRVWRERRQGLRHAASLLEPGWPGLSESLGLAFPPVEAFEEAERMMKQLEDIVRAMEQRVEDAGYAWNWDDCTLTSHTGGRPRTLLRDLVRGAVIDLRATRNTLGLREQIADTLGPFFSPGDLAPERSSALFHAVSNALRSS